ncbi:hypothetical protein C8R43DRAFT_1090766 [Mycena crocata]|nr:hypothetical protein C8R43DRAFT_1090766 [Mycena crocata]
MDSATRARLTKNLYPSDEGRRLSELMKTNEVLKGAESQRLRSFFTSNCMEPSRDLDAYGTLLATGTVEEVKADFERRVAQHTARMPSDGSSSATPEAAATQEIYELRWGPTLVAVYQLLGLMRIIQPARAAVHLDIARFLIEEAKVPVDGKDLSGTQALSHAFSTKPAVDYEYAQLLHDAGGDVNARDRYGGTVAHEIGKVWTPQDKAVVAKATKAMKWFLDHGGNVDIADGDGMTVRRMTTTLERFAPGIAKLVRDVDKERKARARTEEGCCALCGRGQEADPLPRCGRCKTARYCPSGLRACQKLNWPHHKKECMQNVQVPAGEFSFLGTKF